MATRWSRLQQSRASICSWTSACSAISLSKSASGSAMASEMALKRSSRSVLNRRPSMMFPCTSLVGSSSGSWARWPMRRPSLRHTSPSNSLSAPASILSSVDLPAPLGPTMPILAPSRNDADTSLKMTRSPGSTLVTPFTVMTCSVDAYVGCAPPAPPEAHLAWAPPLPASPHTAEASPSRLVAAAGAKVGRATRAHCKRAA
mmetsp:Transcript_10142/g.39507  ORF Transcript_10142/g.39507 Transcript_10142/m.39507 type:complete len:202 (-) Transcript_10142:63-668(-)